MTGKGKCIIFSAPSGAGKTTIVHHLLKQDLNLSFSVSACSREKRQGEVEGKDYHFLAVAEFKDKIANNDFVEWEEVYKDHFYGTLKTEVQRVWDEGKHVIFDVDVIGGLNLKRQFGDSALSIFVMPPSIDVLEKRLRSRKTESDARINQRLAKAAKELMTANEFDVIIQNNNLEDALRDSETVVRQFLNPNRA